MMAKKEFVPNPDVPVLSALLFDASAEINANLGIGNKTKRQARKEYKAKENAGELEIQKLRKNK
jgi:hypothetical protein